MIAMRKTVRMVQKGFETANKAIELANRIATTLQETIGTAVKSATVTNYDKVRKDIKGYYDDVKQNLKDYAMSTQVFQDVHSFLQSDLGSQFNKIIDRTVDGVVQKTFTIAQNSQLNGFDFIEQWMHCMFTRMENLERCTLIYEDYYDVISPTKKKRCTFRY